MQEPVAPAPTLRTEPPPHPGRIDGLRLIALFKFVKALLLIITSMVVPPAKAIRITPTLATSSPQRNERSMRNRIDSLVAMTLS